MISDIRAFKKKLESFQLEPYLVEVGEIKEKPEELTDELMVRLDPKGEGLDKAKIFGLDLVSTKEGDKDKLASLYYMVWHEHVAHTQPISDNKAIFSKVKLLDKEIEEEFKVEVISILIDHRGAREPPETVEAEPVRCPKLRYPGEHQ
jgi:hypothetical protein